MSNFKHSLLCRSHIFSDPGWHPSHYWPCWT